MSSKSQVVIPAAVRREADLKPGDSVTFEVRPEGVLMRKARRTSWVDRLASIGGDHLDGYADTLLRDRAESRR
ncbi:MAG: AbrB/MazE/SpoVT family DNA-binding domain-containing protein [Gemmatimonadetes bacterium]|nr:AbrB/MazE/SpoVT family DNA-binding domain-containing protein [Gemmatimonadota bacterium]